jgi:hypothetical protein
MVAHFLKSEIDSARHGGAILDALRSAGQERRLIDEPDLGSGEENALRARVLGEARGYGHQEGIFKHVPDETAWFRYELTREELARVRYIDYSFWNVLSGGTRLAIDAAPRIRGGIVVFGQSTKWALELAREVERGVVLPELILVGTSEEGPLTVLEGHARLTAYCLALEHLPEPLPVIVGFGAGVDRV